MSSRQCDKYQIMEGGQTMTKEELEKKIEFMKIEFSDLKDKYDILVKMNGELIKENERLKNERVGKN